MLISKSPTTLIIVTWICIQLTLLRLHSGDTFPEDAAPELSDPWTFCDIIDLPALIEGGENSFIREISLTGRYHGQYISQSEQTGKRWNHFDNWQHRRFRLGLDIELAGDLTFVSSVNLSDGSGDSFGLTRGVLIDDLDEFYLRWRPEEDFWVAIGKKKQNFTMEFGQSSKRILTVERSPIVNEVIPLNYPWGVTFGFPLIGAEHELGLGLTGGELDSAGERWEWPAGDSRGGLTYHAEFSVCASTTCHVGYQFTNNAGGQADGAGRADTDHGSQYQHAAHLGTHSDWGKLGFTTDLIVGANREQSGPIPAGADTLGLVVLPTYDITHRLQAVARYAYMDAGREQRYQRYPARQYVDAYHTLYAGLNYYICDHKLKLMGGYEFASGDDLATGRGIESKSWVFAVRTYW